jgi:hypothetical protein
VCAPIYLLEGEHFGGGAGIGRGFGEAHILAAHSHDLRRAKCQTVAQYLARTIVHDTPICSEANKSSKNRVIVMKTSGVIVVLEYRQAPKEEYWRVVTAYKRRKAIKAKEICRVEVSEQ